jgi:hypothetical protein
MARYTYGVSTTAGAVDGQAAVQAPQGDLADTRTLQRSNDLPSGCRPSSRHTFAM